MKLSELIVKIKRILDNLNNVIISTSTNLTSIDREIRRRYFIRQFCNLAEMLIFLRGRAQVVAHFANENPNITNNLLTRFRRQIDITERVSEAKDANNENLIQGFTSFRNKLLHKYLFQYHLGNDEIHTNARRYFIDNRRRIYEEIDSLSSHHDQEFSLSKIPFQRTIEERTYNFVEDYLSPLMVAASELAILFYLLSTNEIAINNLASDQRRNSQNPTELQVYETNMRNQQRALMASIDSNPYLLNCIGNLIENISSALSISNNGYYQLYEGEIDTAYSSSENEESIMDNIWKSINTNYNLLEEDAVKILTDIEDVRTPIAHDSTVPINIDLLINFSILLNHYILPSLEAIRPYAQVDPIRPNRYTIPLNERQAQLLAELHDVRSFPILSISRNEVASSSRSLSDKRPDKTDQEPLAKRPRGM